MSWLSPSCRGQSRRDSDPLSQRIVPARVPQKGHVFHSSWRGCLQLMQLRSEEHTSELQSRLHLVCRLLLEKKKKTHAHVSDTQRAQQGPARPRPPVAVPG